jgi:hypothetical protein
MVDTTSAGCLITIFLRRKNKISERLSVARALAVQASRCTITPMTMNPLERGSRQDHLPFLISSLPLVQSDYRCRTVQLSGNYFDAPVNSR